MQVLPVTALWTGTRVRECLEPHPHRPGAPAEEEDEFAKLVAETRALMRAN
jgi:hypothetical protein